jgi:hypothetical protein
MVDVSRKAAEKNALHVFLAALREKNEPRQLRHDGGSA